MPEDIKSDLRVLFEELSRSAHAYFIRAAREAEPRAEDGWLHGRVADHYYSQLSDETRLQARALVDKALRYCSQLASAARSAPLAGAEDQMDIREASKRLRGALRLREYIFRDLEVVNDEDRVLGVRQPSQSENKALHPTDAQMVFDDGMFAVSQVLKLVEASDNLAAPPQPLEALPAGTKYRPGTAFIMMWMDPERPELADVADAVKAVFRSFGLSASRADDIEHEGQITDRVLNELRTSEFLFADLTGARPNVYYEVGFAHALGRRVILYRKTGTGLHFDLAGYNCPEYTNLRDLKEKLVRRLEAITNRAPTDPDGDA